MVKLTVRVELPTPLYGQGLIIFLCHKFTYFGLFDHFRREKNWANIFTSLLRSGMVKKCQEMSKVLLCLQSLK